MGNANETTGIYSQLVDVHKELGDLKGRLVVAESTNRRMEVAVGRIEDALEKLEDSIGIRPIPKDEKKVLHFFGSREIVLIVVGIAIMFASSAAVVLVVSGNAELIGAIVKVLKGD